MNFSWAEGPSASDLFDAPDVYFSAEYVAAAAEADQGSWAVAVGGDGAILQPLVLRKIPAHDAIDCCSPYGHSGIWVDDAVSDHDLGVFRHKLRDHLAQMRVISEFLRFSPGLTDPERCAVIDPHLSVWLHGPFFELDLQRTYSSIWDTYSGAVRNAIRKAQREGLRSRVRLAKEDDVTRGSTFRRLYEDRMISLGAAPFYLFTDEYFIALARQRRFPLLLSEVLDDQSRVIAVSMVFRGPRYHWHHAASNEEAMRLGANNLLMDAVVRDGIAHGATSLRLGGTVPGREGLTRFKASFGSERLDYFLGGSVIEHATYDQLTLLRGDEPSTYFPAYRKPVPSASSHDHS